jgi:hypothetical protein
MGGIWVLADSIGKAVRETQIPRAMNLRSE